MFKVSADWSTGGIRYVRIVLPGKFAGRLQTDSLSETGVQQGDL
jgi:hypothetical protein